MHKRVLVASALVLFAFGCGAEKAKGGSGGATGSGGAQGSGGAPVSCTKVWTRLTIGTTATSSASVADGALVLRSSNSQSNDLLIVLQRPIMGDFGASFDFESFVSGGSGAFVQAAVAEAVTVPTTPIVTAAIGSLPSAAGDIAGVSATFQPGDVALQPTAATAGTFRFQRVGTSVTATASPEGGTAASVTKGDYGAFNLQVGLQIGTSQAAVIGAETSIRVTAFTIQGGGGAVLADGFDCDSVK